MHFLHVIVIAAATATADIVLLSTRKPGTQFSYQYQPITILHKWFVFLISGQTEIKEKRVPDTGYDMT